MRKFALVCTLLLTVALSACAGTPRAALPTAEAGTPLSFTLDEDGRYTGFDSLPQDYTPEQALADGCFVVTGSNLSSACSTLYGGGEHWTEFLEAAKNGEDAALRKVLFMDGTPYYTDLFYVDGAYWYFDSEYENLSDRPYSYLRCLTGLAGNPQKESTLYVLTDSTELTFEDVFWYYLSSNLDAVTKIPFVWLGFTTYLDAAETAAAPYADWTDITPEAISDHGFQVLKNPETCESVLAYRGSYYQLGIGFGGSGICDLQFCEGGEAGYLLFTYSWGSGLHRSHVAVFDLGKKETVFTSEPFLNEDVMLSPAGNGVYTILYAQVAIGNDFCDLTLTPGDTAGSLTISGDKITCDYEAGE